MATSRVNTLDEEFITCQICFSEFDGYNKKPKFLPCCHTICLECFQTLRRGNTILCPFCRTHTRFNDNSNGVELIPPTNHCWTNVLDLVIRMNETSSYEANPMPSTTAPVREPAEEVDEQFALAQATQEQHVIPEAAAILQPTHEYEPLRLSLETSGREIEVEILNEARRQSLSNQQQSPTLRDVDGHREPQGNTVVVPATQHTTTVPNTTSDDEDEDDLTNEDIFFMLLTCSLIGYYAILVFCQLFTFFWTRSIGSILLGIVFLLVNSAIDSFRVNLNIIFFCLVGLPSYDIFFLLLELSMFFFQSLGIVVGNCISVVFL